jgi:hypothetical protein
MSPYVRKLSAVWLRSGSLMRIILTSDVCFTLFIAWGVIKMNCLPIERRAAWIIISMLRSRLTLSMNTSLD